MYLIMLFELTIGLATFYSYIKKIFMEKLDVFIIMYLDDIFIYTKDKEENHI